VDDDLSYVTNYQMVEDDLDCLLELYNDVLELRKTASSPIVVEGSTPPQRSSEISHLAAVAEPSSTTMDNPAVSGNELNKGFDLSKQK
jgi:hypothetical protein